MTIRELRKLPSSIATCLGTLHQTFEKQLVFTSSLSKEDQAITIQLNEDIDISRGDLLVESNDPIRLKNQFSAQLCWMSQQRVAARQKFILQQGTASTRVIIERIENVLNLENAQREADTSLNLNDIGKVDFKTASPIVTDPFVTTGKHGGFILIDPSTNSTVGAGFMSE